MVYGVEIHDVLQNIFGEVRGFRQKEQIKVCCPKCQERDGLLYPDGKFNLEINTKNNIFKCWKCEAPKFSGTIGKLIHEYGTPYDYSQYRTFYRIYYVGQTFFKNETEDDVDYIVDVKLPPEYISFKDYNPYLKSHMIAYEYWVLERNLDTNLLEKYNIGFCLDGEYKNRLIIPSYDKFGDLNYFTSRSFTKQKPPYLNPNVDREKIIFNEKNINWDSTIYLVEGVFDLFSMPYNTIPLLGKELYSLIFNKIKEKKPNIVLVLDPDAIKQSINIYRDLLSIYGYDDNEKLRIVLLDGKLDIDEIRKKYGQQKISEILRESKQLDFNKLDYIEKTVVY